MKGGPFALILPWPDLGLVVSRVSPNSGPMSASLKKQAGNGPGRLHIEESKIFEEQQLETFGKFFFPKNYLVKKSRILLKNSNETL